MQIRANYYSLMMNNFVVSNYTPNNPCIVYLKLFFCGDEFQGNYALTFPKASAFFGIFQSPHYARDPSCMWIRVLALCPAVDGIILCDGARRGKENGWRNPSQEEVSDWTRARRNEANKWNCGPFARADAGATHSNFFSPLKTHGGSESRGDCAIACSSTEYTLEYPKCFLKCAGALGFPFHTISFCFQSR